MLGRIGGMLLGVALAVSHSAPIQAKQHWLPSFEQELYDGKTGEAVAIAAGFVAAWPNDRLPRFAQGIAMFLDAVRRFGNDMYRYGLTHDSDSSGLGLGLGAAPFLRVPVPPNADPEPITYTKLRQSLTDLVAGLQAAEHELALVKEGEVVLTLDVGKLHLDFDGDGGASSNEALWRLLAAITSGRGVPSDAPSLPVDFDESDVLWLRAYCHLIAAMADFMLGYDWEAVYEATFHGVFPDGHFASRKIADAQRQSRERLAELVKELGGVYLPPLFGFGKPAESPEHEEALLLHQRLQTGGIADVVAFFHLMNWPVADADRLKNSLTHLEAMVSLSRANWVSIQAETDKHREWIPNLGQIGVLPGMRIDQSRIEGWAKVLDELDGILAGRILIPHWRFDEGINLRRIFLEPRPFDLVMLLQGAGAVPYLEKGTKTDAVTWDSITRVFGGNFIQYFLWIN